jgi:hypothetical protein
MLNLLMALLLKDPSPSMISKLVSPHLLLLAPPQGIHMYAFELILFKFSHLLHFGLNPLLASCHLENLDGVYEVVIMDNSAPFGSLILKKNHHLPMLFVGHTFCELNFFVVGH